MRAMSIKNLYEIKHDTYQFTGEYHAVMGTPESNGTWLIYGAEKNGKTWSALLLANYLSTFADVIYVSAEEGFSSEFVAGIKRAGISHDNTKIKFFGYLPIEELKTKLGKRKKTRIVFIDNITVYKDELKHNAIHRLNKEYPNILFIYLAHQEQGKPYGATAQMCKKLAKIIIHVEGLQAQFSGRCTGGIMNINDKKAQLYWGM